MSLPQIGVMLMTGFETREGRTAGWGPAPTVGVCSWDGCQATEVWRCGYRDGQGGTCGLWCRGHLDFSSGVPLCQRHLSLYRLAAQAAPTYDLKQPAAVDDRRPALVTLVVDDADRPVRELLERRFGFRPGVGIATDPAVRYSHAHGWSRGWGVHTNTGYLWRAVVSASGDEPPVVQVRVNLVPVLSATPEWIIDHGTGDPRMLRAAFRDRLVSAVAGSFDEDVLLGPEGIASPAV